MKKNLIITLLFILTYGSANSQSFLGVRSSFNISSLTTREAKSRPGFNLGVMYSTPISHSWHFQPALLYNLSGSKSATNFKPHYSAYSYNLEMPLILSRRFGDEELSFGLDMGTFLKYGLHGSYWKDNLTTGERQKLDIFDHQKRFDVGPQIGFSIFAYNFYVAYSFQYGLIKPWNDMRGNYYTSSITVAYLFEI